MNRRDWFPSLRCDQTPAGRDDPTAAPEYNRVDPSQSRHRVPAGHLQDAMGPFQDGRAANNIKNRPARNGGRARIRRRCSPGSGQALPLVLDRYLRGFRGDRIRLRERDDVPGARHARSRLATRLGMHDASGLVLRTELASRRAS